MTTVLVFFFILAAMTMIGAVGTVTARNVVHAALFLILSLLAVSGLFVLLLAEFLAIVQVLIYGGAITILLLFALMLTRARESALKLDNNQRVLAFLATGAVFAALTVIFLMSDWPGPVEDPQRPGFTGNIGGVVPAVGHTVRNRVDSAACGSDRGDSDLAPGARGVGA